MEVKIEVRWLLVNSCFVGYREVGSIPGELLHGQGGFCYFFVSADTL
jgi:hypothetical protein